MRRSRVVWPAVVALALTAVPPPAAAEEVTVDSGLLEQLRTIIEEQREELDTLRRRVDQLEERKGDSEPSVATPGTARTVTSGEDRIKLSLSGQVNRMVNIADDGDKTKAYHVDNDNSSTRIRFVGTGQVSDDFSVGANIEVEMQSNDSANISQTNESEGSVNFKDRKLEAVFKSKRLGTLSIGQGDTASNSTSEVDLSGASVVAYSSVTDLAGGLFFFDGDAEALTAIRIKDVFSNLDGLSRRDRVRYDTPNLFGFTVSGSAIEDQQYDAALRWGAEMAGFRAAAAVGYAEPKGQDYRINGSASAIHLGTGLNLTVAAGTEGREGSDRDDPLFWYVKGGWLADLVDFGKTAFVVDYTESYDQGADGDEGTSYGAFVVQNLADHGVEFYGGVRLYDLDRAGLDSDAILVGNLGTRVKF